MDVSNPGPYELGDFLVSLAGGCPALRTLFLTIVRNPDDNPSPLPFKCIAPLLPAKAMSKVQLRFHPDHPMPLQMADIVAMGEGLPRIEHLDITSTIPITSFPLTRTHSQTP